MLEHGDNLGNAGALSTGDIQWMTAGRGIIHRELAFRNERAHTLQLWVNLPARLKMVGTRYQDLRAADRPVIDHDGARIDLISGDADGTSGPALNNWPISGTLITLEPNRSLERLLPGRDRAFFYVLSGEVTVAGRAVRAGQIAWSDPADLPAARSIAPAYTTRAGIACTAARSRCGLVPKWHVRRPARNQAGPALKHCRLFMTVSRAGPAG